MLVRIQKAAQTWVAKFVAGVIIVVLVLFGFGAFNLFAINEPIVASVNGLDITERQLTSEIERAKRDFRNTYPTQYTDSQIDGWINEEFALRRIIDSTLFNQATQALRLTISDKQFGQKLQADPQFQMDGEFDESTFRETLQRSGLSVQTLRGLQTESDVRAQLLSVVEDTEFSTPREVRTYAMFDQQTRDISSLEFSLDQYRDRDSVTDEDVATHYELYPDDYMTDGSFDFDYIEITRDKFVEPLDLEEEETQALYDAEVAARDSAAERRGRHILVSIDEDRTEEEALERVKEIKDRLSAGDDFAVVAEEMSDDQGSKADGGDLGFAERGRYVTEFADMLWSLDLNEISEPVKSQFGYHIIELLEVEKIEHPSFEDRREGLLEERQLELASVALREANQEVDKLAFENEDTLQPLADAFEVEIQSIEGVDDRSTEGIFTHSQVRGAFLNTDVTDNGFNSRVVSIDDTSLFVGRMTNRTEPALRPLEEVQEVIKSKIAEERAVDARDASYAEILAQLLDDQDYDAAESQAKSDWVVYANQMKDDSSVDPAILEVAFSLQLTDDEKVIAEAESEFVFSKFIVVVSRQQLADYALLSTDEQGTLDEAVLNNSKVAALTTFLVGLRMDASIETDRVAYTFE